jgi:hypothetical protein
MQADNTTVTFQSRGGLEMAKVRTVFVLIFIVALVVITCTACTSDSIANTVGITAPDFHYGWGPQNPLAVDLKPISAVADVEYRVVLYKKGVQKDEDYVQWDVDEINAKTVKTIYFRLSDSEYSAYNISTGPRTDPKTHAYLGIGYKDLRDIFSVTLEEIK